MKAHILYRHFDSQGRLLYAGRTNNPPVRLAAHRSGKPWWVGVERTTYQEFPTLDALKQAEAAAIRYELPLWNIQGAARGPHEVKEVAPTDIAPFQGKGLSFDVTDLHNQQLSLQCLVAALQAQSEESEIDVGMYRYDLAWHAHEVWSQLCGEPPGFSTDHVPRLDRAIREFADLYSVCRHGGRYKIADALSFTRAVLDLDEARWYRDWPWSEATDFSGGQLDWYALFSVPLAMRDGKATHRAYFVKAEAVRRLSLVYPLGWHEVLRMPGQITWNCWFSLPSFDLPDLVPYKGLVSYKPEN